MFGGKGVGGQSDPLEIYDFSHLYLNSSRDEAILPDYIVSYGKKSYKKIGC